MPTFGLTLHKQFKSTFGLASPSLYIMMATTSQSRSGYLMVAAIDFGTTYSGYAFSTRDDFNKKPTKTSGKTWPASDGLMSLKAPTSVVLGPDGEFLDFGYEAENKYSELAEEGEHEEHYYFARFKMMLYDKDGNIKLTRDTTLEDIRGRTRPALDVFSGAIGYLKKLMLDDNVKRGTSVEETEILWVLTVPAIWDDPAKQFMREAAERAGIPGDRLMIALEPEAASLYCKYINIQKKKDGEDNDLEAFESGQQYLVLDAGGGTVDITVHRVGRDGKLKELERASGGDWGGTQVDNAFIGILREITGKPFLDKYCDQHTADYIDLMRHFELKKRMEERDSKITLTVPVSLGEFFQEECGMEISAKCKTTKYGQKITWLGDKMRMDVDLFKTFFNKACNNMVTHIKELLARPKVRGTNIILMVGGFSESPLLQEKIKSAFPTCRVIIPPEPGLAVLRGAVIYGHDPEAIGERVAKQTYGIGTNIDFDPKLHSQDRKITVDNKDYCSGIFDKYVECGETVKLNEVRTTDKYVPLSKKQTAVTLPFFVTEDKNPKFTDGCTRLGSVTVPIPKSSITGTPKVVAKLKFGGTELLVEGENVDTGQSAKGKFNFLEGRL